MNHPLTCGGFVITRVFSIHDERIFIDFVNLYKMWGNRLGIRGVYVNLSTAKAKT